MAIIGGERMYKPSFKIHGDCRSEICIIRPVFEQELPMSESFYHAITSELGRKVSVVSIGIKHWNDDLSPWNAPPVFGKESFGNGGKDTLDFIEHEIIPLVTGDIILGGYSMAGLFSLWCGYESKCFSAIASASPSVWFPEWMEYIHSHRINAEYVYLSLGDSESSTKNKTIAKVAENIMTQYDRLIEEGKHAILEWNHGGHFCDVEERTKRAFIETIRSLEKNTHKSEKT